MKRNAEFCSGTGIWRFKGFGWCCRTHVQWQICKMQPQLLTKLKSDLESFGKALASPIYQCRAPSLSLSFPHTHLPGNGTGRSEGFFHSRRGLAGLGGAQVSNGSPNLLGQCRERPEGWRSPGESGDSLCPPGDGEGLAELSRGRKWSRLALLLSWGFLVTHPAELGPSWEADAEVSAFPPVPPTKDHSSLWSSHFHLRKLETGPPRGFGDSKPEAVELLSLNMCQNPLSPREWGDLYTPLLPGMNNWMEHLTNILLSGGF